MRILALAVLSATLFTSTGDAAAQEVPIKRVKLSASHLEPETLHYNIFITGKKIGWMKQQFSLTKFEGVDAYEFRAQFEQKLLNDGEELKMTSDDVEYFAASEPYQFLGGSTLSAQNGFESATHIRRSQADGDDGHFVATMIAGKTERVKKLGELDYTLGDVLAEAVWCEEQPAVGDQVRIREFDYTDLEMRTGRHTVVKIFPDEEVGVVERLGIRAKYETEYVEEIAKLSGRFKLGPAGQLISGEIAGAILLELTTAEDAVKLVANLDLFESTLIKVDQPLGDPSDVRELVLEITGKSAAAIVDSANQDAEHDAASGRTLLKLGRKHGEKLLITAEERAKSLEETTEYPVKDAQIIALTEKAIGSATRPKARIKRLVDFVDQFIIDDTASEPLSVNDIIDTQRGDCTEHSQLFVTMARAAGIPARLVSGFIYGEGSFNSFGGHAWCEVEVDGHWHPVDPTWGETMINATHIRISGDRPSTEELAVYMGGLQFRVLSVTDRSGRRQEFADPTAK